MMHGVGDSRELPRRVAWRLVARALLQRNATTSRRHHVASNEENAPPASEPRQGVSPNSLSPRRCFKADEPRGYRKSKDEAVVSGSLSRVGSAASRGRSAEHDDWPAPARSAEDHGVFAKIEAPVAAVGAAQLTTAPREPRGAISQ